MARVRPGNPRYSVKVLCRQRFSDVVTGFLQAGKSHLQRLEQNARPHEFKLAARPPQQTLSLGNGADTAAPVVQQFIEAVFGQLQRVKDRPREEAVQQDEL